MIPTYEISNISARFGLHILNNKYVINNYLQLIAKEKNNLKNLCEIEDIDYYIGEINTCFVKPNNISAVISYMEKEKILFRTRKLPHDFEDWIALVIYPGICESDLMKKIIKFHENVEKIWKKIFLNINWYSKDVNLITKEVSINELLTINGHISKTGEFNIKIWEGSCYRYEK